MSTVRIRAKIDMQVDVDLEIREDGEELLEDLNLRDMIMEDLDITYPNSNFKLKAWNALPLPQVTITKVIVDKD